MKTKKMFMLLCAASVFSFYSCTHSEDGKSANGEKNKQAVLKLYDAYMSGNTDDLGNCIAGNMKENTPDPAAPFEQQGLAGIKNVVKFYHDAFPALKIT